MRKQNSSILFFLAATLVVVVTVSVIFLRFFPDGQFSLPHGEKMDIPPAERQVFSFVTEEMSSSDFLMSTSLSENGEGQELPEGRDILSESQGLMLLYFVNRDQKDAFDRCLSATYENLYQKNDTFLWVKRASAQQEPVNALIDDFRILRSLILAYEKWGGAEYKTAAGRVSAGLIACNTEGGVLLDFYNLAQGAKSPILTLSYADLYTMQKLSAYDTDWRGIYKKALALARGGKIGKTGLYAHSYDLVEKSYTVPDEIQMIQSVYVLLHLAEAGQPDREGIEWLWGQVGKYGKIFARYDGQKLVPSTDMESTALYALAARTFYAAGQKDRAATVLSLCDRFRVRNENSNMYGGFGEETTKEFYSFDNLAYLVSSSIIYQ